MSSTHLTTGNMSDLETDGSALASHDFHPDRMRRITKAFETNKGDSGICSMPSMDVTDSLKPHDEAICESGDSMCEASLHLNFDKMHLTEDDTICDSDKSPVQQEVDEGYISKSITEFTETNPFRSVQENAEITNRPSKEAFEVYTQDDEGDTQLHMAVIQLAQDIALQLINLAPNQEFLNICNTLLQTPLHLAVLTRQEKIVRRLMAAGASVDVRDLHGNTPLHIATREGYQEIVAHLLKPVYYEETSDNKYEIPYQRVPQDLEMKNYDGLACLHLAALGTHTPVMTQLLSKGANINTQDGKSGRTVLHYAAESGNRILLEYVLGCRRLNLDCVTYGGLTPILLAAGRRYGDVVGILQAHGADYSSLQLDDDEDDDMIDDFCIGGEPLSIR